MAINIGIDKTDSLKKISRERIVLLRIKWRMDGWERQDSDPQNSGRPLYAFMVGCRLDEELKCCLLESVAKTIEEVAFVGYVLGSEGFCRAR